MSEVVFPIDMPVGVATEYFEIERFDAVSPTSDGPVSGVTLGFPRWRGRWGLGKSISQDQSDEWRAFVSLLRGQQKTFLGFDQGRPMPKLYPDGFAGLVRPGGAAFDGAATTWSVNATRDVPTLGGYPPGFVLSIGDYIMWRWVTGGEMRRSLCRVMRPAVAASNGVMTVRVEPPLPTLTPGTSVADINRPTCVMKRIVEDGDLGEKDRSLKVSGTIGAIQDLRD